MKWFTINNKADKKTVDVLIYGSIVDEKWLDTDVTPTDFKAAMDALSGVDTVNFYINSPGGNIFAGNSIYNIIKRMPANTIAYVDGIAASIASDIIQGCDKIIVFKNSMIMIHKPLTQGLGNAKDFRKLADVLDKTEETIISTYLTRAKVSKEEIALMMDAETWMTGEEAVKNGFADELQDDKNFTACMQNNKFILNGTSIDISNYKSFPKEKFINNKSNQISKIETAQPLEPETVNYSYYENRIKLNNNLVLS